MKKRGFTLIELLAVIVILAIIAVIAVPTILNIINNAQKSAFKDSAYGIIKSGEMYYTDKMMEESGMTEDKTFTFPDAVGLEVKGSKPSNGIMIVTKEGKIALAIHNGKYCATKGYNTDEVTISDNVTNCSFIVAYKETELNGADPELKEGMIPITISNEGIATVADIETSWYKYGQKKWANVVTITEASRNKYINNDGTYKSGTTVTETDILTYLTWIPRYKYKLWYTEATDEQVESVDATKVHSIDIVFESKNTEKSNGTTNGSYLTHPAFTFGSEEVNGMWVGKFETGYAGAASKTAAQISTADSTKVIIKPNTYSWRSINVSNAYNTALGMNDTNNVYGLTSASDTHMMKNSEWGAVAYLSHSSYGKDGEVYINNNSNFTTGCGGDTASEGSNATCKNGYGTKSNGEYNQSTSGNITGVFDMSGGAWEYVMGYTTNMEEESDYSEFASLPVGKYVDTYSSTNDTEYSKRILGDATGEMGPFSYDYVGSWYNDYAFFAFSYCPWFLRGGGYINTSLAGVFGFGNGDGVAVSDGSFRVVLV